MISAVDEIDSVIRCIELGAEDYLAKPFNPTLLRARVGASLEKKRLRDELVRHTRRIEKELKIGARDPARHGSDRLRVHGRGTPARDLRHARARARGRRRPLRFLLGRAANACAWSWRTSRTRAPGRRSSWRARRASCACSRRCSRTGGRPAATVGELVERANRSCAGTIRTACS